jgi:hypothetical protein
MCVRLQARDLPFNRYAWLTTHNSFARLGQKSQTGVAIATPWNQQDTVTEQLNVTLLPSSSVPLASFCISRAESSASASTGSLVRDGMRARRRPRTQLLASTYSNARHTARHGASVGAAAASQLLLLLLSRLNP